MKLLIVLLTLSMSMSFAQKKEGFFKRFGKSVSRTFKKGKNGIKNIVAKKAGVDTADLDEEDGNSVVVEMHAIESDKKVEPTVQKASWEEIGITPNIVKSEEQGNEVIAGKVKEEEVEVVQAEEEALAKVGFFKKIKNSVSKAANNITKKKVDVLEEEDSTIIEAKATKSDEQLSEPVVGNTPSVVKAEVVDEVSVEQAQSELSTEIVKSRNEEQGRIKPALTKEKLEEIKDTLSEGLTQYHLTLEEIKAYDENERASIIPAETLIKSDMYNEYDAKTKRVKVRVENEEGVYEGLKNKQLYVDASDMLHQTHPVIAPALLNADDVFTAAAKAVAGVGGDNCKADESITRKKPSITSMTVTKEEHSISEIAQVCNIEPTADETKKKHLGLNGVEYSDAELGRDSLVVSMSDTKGNYNRFTNMDRRTMKCLDKLNKSYGTSRFAEPEGIVVLLKKTDASRGIANQQVEVLIVSPLDGADSMKIIKTTMDKYEARIGIRMQGKVHVDESVINSSL